MDRSSQDNLWYWMNERHRIYLYKSGGLPPPWTGDTILQQYRFCNVFRELDTVTIWIRENIREPFADHPNLWFMLAIARTYNLPPVLQDLMDGEAWPTTIWEPARATEVLLRRQARGLSLHTGAYMIRAESDPNVEWYRWPKARYLNEIVLGQLWKLRDVIEPKLHDTLEKAHAEFLPHRGWGPFMSYEVVTDLRWTRYLREAPDIMTWANPGPGANRGLNRYFGRDLNTKLKTPVLIDEMRDLLAIANGPDSPLEPHVPRPLEMRDIEHSLCEFDKYERVRLGEGRPRSKYEAAEKKPV